MPKAKTKSTTNFDDLIKKIEEMKVQELNEFVKALEEKFGPVMAAVAAPTSQTDKTGAPAEKADIILSLLMLVQIKLPLSKWLKKLPVKD